MGVLAKYVKAAGETKRYQIYYTNWLDTGESVSSVVFAVQGTPTSPPLTINNVQVTPDGLGVQYYASGGVDGVDYTVNATLTTAGLPNPQTKLDQIFISVREPS